MEMAVEAYNKKTAMDHISLIEAERKAISFWKEKN